MNSDVAAIALAAEQAAIAHAERTRADRQELLAAGIILLTGIGEDTTVLWIDDLAGRLLGLDTALARGMRMVALDPSLSPHGWQERSEAAATEAIVYRTHFRRDDTGPRSYEVRLERPLLRDIATPHTLLVAFVSDYLRSVEIEHSWQSATRRWELIASAARDGLWSWDVNADQMMFSSRWCALIGLPEMPVHAPSEAWLRRVHPSDVDSLRTAVDEYLQGITPILLHEHRMEHENGTWRWCVVRATADFDSHGLATVLAGSTSDVTHRKNAEERLRYEAFHDSLTGLANRAWLIHQLQEAITGAREGTPFAVIVLGLDGFKLVNDSFGPSIGDMLLRSVATRLLRNVRAADTVARLAGDEFLVLLDDVADHDDAQIVAERIQQDLTRAFDLRGYSVFASASMGMLVHTGTYLEPEELLRDANIALVRAKSLGRGKRRVFDASMRHETVRRLMLETDLRRALERSELTLHYQPIVRLDDGSLLGLEALARWNHTKQGPISPVEFIPLAEDSGLILSIGKWALLSACEEAMTWPALPDGRRPWVAVNVSGRQLMHPGFCDDVRDILRLTAIEPERLHLEITESVLMENTEYAREILGDLRDLGVMLAIDDFGTGYSSLAALRRFPIQTLKVDRAFLAKDSNQHESWAIVEAISSLARVLGKEIVVEGVEDAADAHRLRELGCHAAQGYLFSRPIPYEQLISIMSISGLAMLARRAEPKRAPSDPL